MKRPHQRSTSPRASRGINHQLSVADSLTAWDTWLKELDIAVDPDESAAICTHWIHADGAPVPLLPAALDGKYQQFAKKAAGLAK